MDNEEKRLHAEWFLSEIRKQKLTGKEFLALIGNTKISNDAYYEIKTNTQLTYKRLVEIFANSSLEGDDYNRIVKAAKVYAERKEKAQQKQAEETAAEEKPTAAEEKNVRRRSLFGNRKGQGDQTETTEPIHSKAETQEEQAIRREPPPSARRKRFETEETALSYLHKSSAAKPEKERTASSASAQPAQPAQSAQAAETQRQVGSMSPTGGPRKRRQLADSSEFPIAQEAAKRKAPIQSAVVQGAQKADAAQEEDAPLHVYKPAQSSVLRNAYRERQNTEQLDKTQLQNAIAAEEQESAHSHAAQDAQSAPEYKNFHDYRIREEKDAEEDEDELVTRMRSAKGKRIRMEQNEPERNTAEKPVKKEKFAYMQEKEQANRNRAANEDEREKPAKRGGDAENFPPRTNGRQQSKPSAADVDKLEEPYAAGRRKKAETSSDTAYSYLEPEAALKKNKNLSDETDDFADKLADYEVGEEDEGYEEGDNRGKIILSACLAAFLLLFSLGQRYFETGTFLPDFGGKLVISSPINFSELAAVMSKLVSAEKEPVYQFETQYYSKPEEKKPPQIQTMCHTDGYIFRIRNNTLSTLQVSSGQMQYLPPYQPDGMELKTIFLHQNRLYAVSTGTYENVYFDADPIGAVTERDADGNPVVQEISETFLSEQTSITVFDAVNFSSTPVQTIQLDGTFNAYFIADDGLYFLTDYVPENTNARNDMRAFIPAYAINGEELQFIDFQHVFVPESGNRYANMNVILSILPDNTCSIAACMGGKAAWGAAEGDTFFLVQQEKGEGRQTSQSRVVKYTADETGLLPQGYTLIDGMVPYGGIDYREGILRVAAAAGDAAALHLYDTALNQLSAVDSIASGSALTGVLFDERCAYFVAESLYAVDTTVPEEPLFSNQKYSDIYSDEFMIWDADERLSAEILKNDKGEAIGLRLIMFKAAKGELSEQSRFDLTAETLNDNAQTMKLPYASDPESLTVSPETGQVVVPVQYFNGISTIEKFIVLQYSSELGFAEKGSLTNYDWNKSYHRSACIGRYLYTFWDDDVVSADGQLVKTGTLQV